MVPTIAAWCTCGALKQTAATVERSQVKSDGSLGAGGTPSGLTCQDAGSGEATAATRVASVGILESRAGPTVTGRLVSGSLRFCLASMGSVGSFPGRFGSPGEPRPKTAIKTTTSTTRK